MRVSRPPGERLAFPHAGRHTPLRMAGNSKSPLANAQRVRSRPLIPDLGVLLKARPAKLSFECAVLTDYRCGARKTAKVLCNGYRFINRQQKGRFCGRSKTGQLEGKGVWEDDRCLAGIDGVGGEEVAVIHRSGCIWVESRQSAMRVAAYKPCAACMAKNLRQPIEKSEFPLFCFLQKKVAKGVKPRGILQF